MHVLRKTLSSRWRIPGSGHLRQDLVGALLAIIVSLNLVGCASDASRDGVVTREDSFPVTASTTLYVDLFRGSISLTANSSGQVSAHAVIHSPSSTNYRARRVFNSIEIVASPLTMTGPTEEFIELQIEAPPDTHIVLKTAAGEIVVTGFTAGVEIRSSNGPIAVSGLRGDLTATTSNAPIVVTRLDGSARLETTAADISVQGRFAGGSENYVVTSSGGVRVDLDDNLSINDNPSVRFDAQTVGGVVHVAYPVKTTVNQRGHWVGTIGSGRANLTVRTSDGSIDIY